MELRRHKSILFVGRGTEAEVDYLDKSRLACSIPGILVRRRQRARSEYGIESGVEFNLMEAGLIATDCMDHRTFLLRFAPSNSIAPNEKRKLAASVNCSNDVL
jgi:hypothetical protein